MGTYYVAQGGTAANKGAADGGSYPSGYMSPGTHNSETFSAGDTIRISDIGGVIRTSYFTPPSSGSGDSNRITYQGINENGSLPVMAGVALVTGWTNYSGNIWQASVTWYMEALWVDGIRGTSQSGIGSLAADGDFYFDDAGDTVYLYDSSGDPDNHNSPGVEVTNTDRVWSFNLKNWITVDSVIVEKTSYAGVRGYEPGNGLTFSNCEFREHTNAGIAFGNSGDTVYTDLIIEDCSAHDNGVSGIAVNWQCQGAIIRRNDVYDNHWTGDTSNLYTAGIKCFDGDGVMRNIAIYENKVHGNGYDWASNNQGVGVGIWMDAVDNSATYPSHIYRNLVYDNEGDGIFAELSSYCYIYNNVVYDNAAANGGDEFTPAGIAIDARLDMVSNYNKVYNNTVVGGKAGIKVVTYSQSTGCSVSYNDVRNNIAVGQSLYSLLCMNGGDNAGSYGTGNVYNSNCFGAESNDFIRWQYTYCDTYDAFITASSQTDNNIESDPTFADETGGKYWQLTGSSCIDVGTDLGAEYGVCLRKGSSWPDGVITSHQDWLGSGWEIGAYGSTEYMASQISDALLQQMLNWAFDTTGEGTRPTNWYVALYNTAPTSNDYGTDSGSVEVSAGGYARVSAAFTYSAGNLLDNDSAVTFGPATADWGTNVVAFGIYSASSGGTYYGGGDLTTSRDVNNGDSAEFAAGDLTISINNT